jgi:signal transduction histidine kinase
VPPPEGGDDNGAVRTFWRRWVCLLAGGALLAPYPMMFLVWTTLFHGPLLGVPAPAVIGAADLLLALAVGVLPVTRRVEAAIARSLLGEAAAPPTGSPWRPQWRAAVWHWLHLGIGAVAAVLTAAAPFGMVSCLAAPFVDGVVVLPGWHSRTGWPGLAVAAAGLLVLAATAGLVVAGGAVLTRAAPVLLGPSPAERLADLGQEARALAQRNRLARELHDSIGHALTVTTLQAGTAHRLFDRDPAFARQALAAIADTGRTALADLDHLIGVLREDAPVPSPPGLADLDELLAANRALGVGIDATIVGPVGEVPGAVSREMFRIVQESLTNVVAHAGSAPVTLRLAATAEHLELDVVNPIGPRQRRPRRHGGRGLPGMRERVRLLRGDMSAAAEGDRWRVRVRLPRHPAT